MMFPEYYKHH